jgi:hypothetical protein
MQAIRKKIKKIIFTVLIFIPILILAGDLEIRYPRIGEVTFSQFTHPAFYARYIFNFALAVISVFAFFTLILAGFQYITSAGNPQLRKIAKERIKSALLAILLLAFTYVILTAFRREFGELATIYPPSFPSSTPYSPPQYSYDPLLHIRDTAQKMYSISNEIKNLTEEFKKLLSECKCENATTSCGFSQSCSFLKCLGDPCPHRQEIDDIQIKLKIKLEELLFYHRMLKDAVKKENLQAEFLSKFLAIDPSTKQLIEIQFDNLRKIVEKLENPISNLKPLILEYTSLSNKCKMDDKCKGECQLIETSIQECRPSPPNCQPISDEPICPMDEIEQKSQEILKLIDEIQKTLNQIINFVLNLLIIT